MNQPSNWLVYPLAGFTPFVGSKVYPLNLLLAPGWYPGVGSAARQTGSRISFLSFRIRRHRQTDPLPH